MLPSQLWNLIHPSIHPFSTNDRQPQKRRMIIARTHGRTVRFFENPFSVSRVLVIFYLFFGRTRCTTLSFLLISVFFFGTHVTAQNCWCGNDVDVDGFGFRVWDCNIEQYLYHLIITSFWRCLQSVTIITTLSVNISPFIEQYLYHLIMTLIWCYI